MSEMKNGAPHGQTTVADLRADRELALELMKLALESLGKPKERAAALLALRSIAEAYGGLQNLRAPAEPAKGHDVKLNSPSSPA